MGLLEEFNYYYYDLADPRMKDWILIRSIWTPILIVGIYILTVFKIAPDYMKNRPAYKLNTFIKCYNLFQILTNAYMVKEFASCYQFHRALECRPIVYSMDPCAIRIMETMYLLIILKILDLIETVIFVLRKKNNQVTVLHVYHHISTALFALIFARYFSSEVSLSLPMMNSLVHVIMYTYYFLSNFEGPIKNVIAPYKRHLTIIQMVQFILVLIQGFVIIVQDCELPKFPLFLMILNVLFNLRLFYNFYKKTYIDKKQKNN